MMNHKAKLLIGKEDELETVTRVLRDMARATRAPVVGAMHITCADESEFECMNAFQRGFVNRVLPELKFACRTPFRLSNLGARYEEGALAVAEHHYATPETKDSFKLLVVKVNAHVAVDGRGAAARFGSLERYQAQSSACGALHALLDGKRLPALDELRKTFQMGGIDRLAQLLDPEQVDPRYRSLFVSLVSARLQTRRVEVAAGQHQPHTPTLYVVVSCVTLNRPGRDTELLCGLATIDRRGEPQRAAYVGLEDDPTHYQVQDDPERLQITDDAWPSAD